MKIDLSARRAIVTASASGIGLACVELLRDRGARVVMADLDATRTAEIADRTGVHAAAFDVADREAVTAAHARLQREGFDFDVIDAHYYYPDGVAAAGCAKVSPT